MHNIPKHFYRVAVGYYAHWIWTPLSGCYTTFWRKIIYSDSLHWSDITPNLDMLQNLTLLPNSNFYLSERGFYRTQGAIYQQRTPTSPYIWSCPTWGLACVIILRPIFPKVVLFPDFWVSNILRYTSILVKPQTNGAISPNT